MNGGSWGVVSEALGFLCVHTHTHTYTADTAYCKNKETGKWHNFDDSHVSETTDDHVTVRLPCPPVCVAIAQPRMVCV